MIDMFMKAMAEVAETKVSETTEIPCFFNGLSESQEDLDSPVATVESQEKTDVKALEDSSNGNDVEPQRKEGGRFRDVYVEGEGDKYEIHHMPADSASFLPRDDGPAIRMEKLDHQQTASWGSSHEAREYRQMQRNLVEQGKFREAIEMDISDIRDKFGDKYDTAIREMLEYVDQLEVEGL